MQQLQLPDPRVLANRPKYHWGNSRIRSSHDRRRPGENTGVHIVTTIVSFLTLTIAGSCGRKGDGDRRHYPFPKEPPADTPGDRHDRSSLARCHNTNMGFPAG